MQTIRFIKDYNEYKVGDIEIVSNNLAFGFIDKGVAILWKPIQNQEEKMFSKQEDSMMRIESESEVKQEFTKRKYKAKEIGSSSSSGENTTSSESSI